MALPPDAGQDAGPGAGAPPAFPAHLLSVAEWRRRLRGLIYDLPLLTLPGEIVDPSLLVTVPDAALDEALREALSAYAVWVPSVRALPPLALSPTQVSYPLPADFDEPDLSGAGRGGWTPLLGPDPLESGRYPGARHALLQRQALLDAPASYGSRGRAGYAYGTYGFGGFWAGGSWDGTWPIPPTDAQGNILDGGAGLYGQGMPPPFFYPASFDSPTPVLVFAGSPPARTLSGLRYRALWLPRRLALTPDGSAWATDPATGSLLATPCPPGQDFQDGTDVLPFWAGDDAVRLTLRYAQGWALTQKVLPLAESDAVKYAFFEERVGLGRKDILEIADRALGEFNDRTRKVPRGARG